MCATTSSPTQLVAVVCLILWGTQAPLLAYIDPGTGSMVIQGLIGLAAAGAVAVRVHWKKVTSFARRIFGKGA